MLLAFLILSILFSTAEAVIPLRLVEEIQLPARTITWDVQHYEDSISFGWAAVTEGEAIWTQDSVGHDSLVSPALDTIWYQPNLESEIDYMLFSRQGFNNLEESIGWQELTMMSIPLLSGPAVAARVLQDYDDDVHFLLYLDLSGDSILSQNHIFEESDNNYYSLGSLEAWPGLPSPTVCILVAGTHRSITSHAGCDTDSEFATGFAYFIEPFSRAGISCFEIDTYNRSSLIEFAYIGGRSTYFSGCDNPRWDRAFHIGSIQHSFTFQAANVDTLSDWGHVTEQEDIDGTKRIFHSSGACYDAATSETVFVNENIVGTILSAFIRNVPGEDFLSFNSDRFMVYDGRTGQLVDSTTHVLGVPQYQLISSGFDEILTYDDSTKIVRIYKPFVTLLTILATESGQVELTWTESPGAIAYQLDRAEDSDFDSYVSDFFSPDVTSITLDPQSGVEFFRVTPLFE